MTTSNTVTAEPDDTASLPEQTIWLTTKEVADRFRTAPSSVSEWRRRGTGPRGSAIFGKQRLYPAHEVARWEQEQISKENGR